MFLFSFQFVVEGFPSFFPQICLSFSFFQIFWIVCLFLLVVFLGVKVFLDLFVQFFIFGFFQFLRKVFLDMFIFSLVFHLFFGFSDQVCFLLFCFWKVFLDFFFFFFFGGGGSSGLSRFCFEGLWRFSSGFPGVFEY